MRTHEVLNQAPALQDYDPFAADAALAEALRREGAGWAEGDVARLAQATATREAIAWGFEANQNPPRRSLAIRCVAAPRSRFLQRAGRIHA